ncbi:MAG: DUF1819 family protein [Desulfuromonadaceae bacterium]
MPELRTQKPYSLTFTAASLRPELARIVAEIYLENGDWKQARKKVISDNALQARSPSSAARMEIEFRHRLQTLSPRQIEILATAPADSRLSIAWLSVLKHSAFVFDFTEEVLRSKLENHDAVLRHSDYENFFNTKSVLHPELVALQPATQSKIHSGLKTMFREVGIMGQSIKDNSLRRPLLTPEVLASILADNRRWLAGFLVPDNEIATL